MTAMLEIKGVHKDFVKRLDMAAKIAARLGADVKEEVVHAVDNVTMDVAKGEVVGLVGESGCGKSTLGRMVAGILEPTAGEIFYQGKKVAGQGESEKSQAMLAIQMIFQDPFASLNPRMRVEDIVGEAPVVHKIVAQKDMADYVREVMLRVGLDPEYIRRYPHQFSGGQRQRIVIMYLGRVVEVAPTDELFDQPNHPYTVALLKEVPRLDIRGLEYSPISGEIPSPLDPPPGCHFHPRCPHATDTVDKPLLIGF